jgi:pantoate--beta-alanine ligase
MAIEVIENLAALRARLSGVRNLGFVPTMGNLHEGHLALARQARARADVVVASIFVNRLQFAPHEDFDRYPRTFAADCAALESEAVDIVFAPDEATLYPRPQAYFVQTPALADELEGAFRPGFFRGVCTVVLKLFNAVQPDFAVFGKKDRQQLEIVRGMVEQFNLPIEILAGETVRAADGLALSSRNGYLSGAERAEAPTLHLLLRKVARGLQVAIPNHASLEQTAMAELRARGWAPDYVAVRKASGLQLPAAAGPVRGEAQVVLGAARLGTTRLIDNVDVTVGE